MVPIVIRLNCTYRLKESLMDNGGRNLLCGYLDCLVSFGGTTALILDTFSLDKEKITIWRCTVRYSGIGIGSVRNNLTLNAK